MLINSNIECRECQSSTCNICFCIFMCLLSGCKHLFLDKTSIAIQSFCYAVCLSVGVFDFFCEFFPHNMCCSKNLFFWWTVFFDKLCLSFDRLKFSPIQDKKTNFLHLTLIIMSVCSRKRRLVPTTSPGHPRWSPGTQRKGHLFTFWPLKMRNFTV